MGLFGGGFTKPGPGIDKNAPKKKGIFLYFEIFFRKFWKLMQLNMIYFLFCLPLFLLVYFFAPISSDFIARISEGFTTNPDELQVLQSSLMLTLRMMASLGVVTFFGFGVAAPGYSYILRCFTNETPTFLFSDFWDHIKANIKHGLIFTVIDILVLVFGFNAVYFYMSIFGQTHQNIWLFIGYLTGVLILIYTMMHAYIYQLAVTFEGGVVQILRNAVMLTIAKLPMNLLLTAIGAGLFILAFLFTNPVISAMIFIFIWTTFIRFPMEFYAVRVIQRNILDNPKFTVKKQMIEE